MPSPFSTRSSWMPCTSTGSRSAAWSPSNSRCATRRRVRSLVFGATQAGGPRAARAEREVMDFFARRPNMEPEEAAWASVPFNYGPRCRTAQVDRIAEDIAQRLKNPFKRGRLQGAALRRGATQLLRPAERHPRAHTAWSTVATTASSPWRTGNDRRAHP